MDCNVASGTVRESRNASLGLFVTLVGLGGVRVVPSQHGAFNPGVLGGDAECVWGDPSGPL